MASGPIVGGDDGAKEKPKHKVYTRKVFKDRKKDPNALNAAATATGTAKSDDTATAKNEDTATATTTATTTAENDNNDTAKNNDTATTTTTTTATTTAKNDNDATAKNNDTATTATTATAITKDDDTATTTTTTTVTTTAKNDDTATVTTIATTIAKNDDNATTTAKTEDTATAKNNNTATPTAKDDGTTTTTSTDIPSASETATATATATNTTTTATVTTTATTITTLPPSATTPTTSVEITTATKSIDDSNNNSTIKSSDTDEPKGDSNDILEEPLPPPGAVPEDGNSILLQVSPRIEDGSSSQPQEKSGIEDGGSAPHQENSRLEDGVSAVPLENSILMDESSALVQENFRLEDGELAQPHAASRLEDKNLAQPQVSSRLEDEDLAKDQPQGSSRLEAENVAQPQPSSRMEDEDLTQDQPQGSSRLDIEISAQPQVSSRLENEDLAQDQPHTSSTLDLELSAQPQTSSRLEDENFALPQVESESRLGVGKSAQPPVVMLSDDSCSHQQEEPSTSLNVTQNLPLRNETMERGLEDRIKISLSSKSKQERQELRWKLESELDVVRNLVKRIELKQGHAGGYGRLNVLVGDGINNSSGMKRSLSEVASVGVPRGSARPLHQLSLSMLENSQGVSESVEKEKRTPKANQFYRNSEFLLAKDKFPPAESNKKSKLSLKRQGGGEMGQGLAMGSKFFKSCSSLLEKLMKHKHAWVFNAPVDVEGLGLHDYYSIITHPMDLGTVKSRLNKNWYKSPKEFAEDVRLTFHNAMTYNPKGQDVHVMAEQLLKIFEDRWAIIESDYNREMRYGIDYGAAPPVPSPLSRRVPTFPPPPLDMRRILDRSESLNHTPRLMTITPSSRTPAPKKPKAKDPNKRDMTFEEKQKLSTNLQSLPSEKLDAIVQIIKKRNSALSQHDDEIEVDIDSVDAETLWELDRFVTNYKKSLSKNKRKLELAQARAEAARNAVQKSQAPVLVVVPRETQADERNVPPFLPVQGGNQAGNGSRSSSSSSSSSDSGSSSDSDSDSSSASGSDAGSQGT